MSVAGISPSEIFTALASIDLYGELRQNEKIAKDISIMIDSITALIHAIEVSPRKISGIFTRNSLGPFNQAVNYMSICKIPSITHG